MAEEIISTGVSDDMGAESEADPVEGMQEPEVRDCDVPASMHGWRIDKTLAMLVPEFSRSYLQQLMADGAVRIRGTIAGKPDVILMDEPCSALDPIATTRIEDLMHDLRKEYTIVIVTHNMQQAARVADRTAFFTALADEGTGDRTGVLVEFGKTTQIFEHPNDQRTEDYISGRFG